MAAGGANCPNSNTAEAAKRNSNFWPLRVMEREPEKLATTSKDGSRRANCPNSNTAEAAKRNSNFWPLRVMEREPEKLSTTSKAV